MNTSATDPHRSAYWQWVHVGVAALAMVATMPGRTYALGLFTEPILATFRVDPETYGLIGLAATLLGALFCLPCGWLADRVGTRAVLVGVMVLLAVTVFALAGWTGGTVGLFVLVLLTRGFGQGALSVASLTLVGRTVGGKPEVAMGVYSFLTTVGFITSFGVVTEVIKANPAEWRRPWAGIGVGVLGAAVLSLALVRNRLLAADGGERSVDGPPSRTLGEAVRSAAFWAFALGTSLFGLVTSGTSLFNESILAERGFGKDVFLTVTYVGIPAGLAASLVGGWLATWLPPGRLFAAAMAVLAVTLAVFPFVRSEGEVYLYAVGLAASGGVIAVCFFTIWRRLYGPAELGRIQGAAQLLTVSASGLGQALFPAVKARCGEYAPLFAVLAGVSLLLAVFSWFAPVNSPPSATAR